MGAKKHPFYRIVAADARAPRDGRFIEILGFYDPMTDPANIKIDEDKLYKWLDNGAIPTENMASVLKKEGLLEKWQLLKSGVKVSEIDSVIEARREKQPKAEEKKSTKVSKKALAAAAKGAEEKLKAEAAAKAEKEAKAKEEAAKELETAAEETGSEIAASKDEKALSAGNEDSSPEVAGDAEAEDTPKE